MQSQEKTGCVKSVATNPMIEAVKFWNEPNNKSHWAFEIDPEWKRFSDMVRVAGIIGRIHCYSLHDLPQGPERHHPSQKTEGS